MLKQWQGQKRIPPGFNIDDHHRHNFGAFALSTKNVLYTIDPYESGSPDGSDQVGDRCLCAVGAHQTLRSPQGGLAHCFEATSFDVRGLVARRDRCGICNVQ